jgi:N-acetylneuraminate synthase
MKKDILKYINSNTEQLFYAKPYIIAEAGVNHECNLDTAYKLIDLAKEGGADAIKFQTYKAETIAVKNSPAYWDLKNESTETQYKLFKKYDLFLYEEMAKHKNRCDSVDLEFLSTPFDIESSNFLKDMMKVIKISSSDLKNLMFIEHLCGLDKDFLLSTGASSVSEIEKTINFLNKHKRKTGIMHCVLNYPTNPINAQFNRIQILKNKFTNHLIGYSDHLPPSTTMKELLYSISLGARIIEKHFTHDKSLPGNDHYHAMDIKDLKKLKNEIDDFYMLLGKENLSIYPNEELARANARRSIVSAVFIPKGILITKEMLTFKRPGHGINPASFEDVIGSKSTCDINEDEIIQPNMIQR